MRQTLAASVGEVARVVGRENAGRDLVRVWGEFVCGKGTWRRGKRGVSGGSGGIGGGDGGGVRGGGGGEGDVSPGSASSEGVVRGKALEALETFFPVLGWEERAWVLGCLEGVWEGLKAWREREVIARAVGRLAGVVFGVDSGGGEEGKGKSKGSGVREEEAMREKKAVGEVEEKLRALFHRAVRDGTAVVRGAAVESVCYFLFLPPTLVPG